MKINVFGFSSTFASIGFLISLFSMLISIIMFIPMIYFGACMVEIAYSQDKKKEKKKCKK